MQTRVPEYQAIRFSAERFIYSTLRLQAQEKAAPVLVLDSAILAWNNA